MSIGSVYFVCDFSTVATCPSMPAAHCAFCVCLIRFVFVVHSRFVLRTKAEPRARVGRPQNRKENPQKLTQLSSRSHPRHLVGKRTAQKDTTIDTTSDSQVNSNFTYRWSPASLTFNNYFYLFLYLYIT